MKVTSEKAYEALDLYFKCCAIQTDITGLCKYGAMLANNGVNPTTGLRVISP
jgi:glutaminase